MDKLSELGLLYVHAVEPRISGASDSEPTDDSLEPLRKAFKVPPKALPALHATAACVHETRGGRAGASQSFLQPPMGP